MPITTTFEPVNNLIRNTYIGEIRPEEILRSALEEHAHPDFQQGMDSLGDFSSAKLVDINFDVVHTLSAHMEEIEKTRGQCRWAMVSSNLINYGILRMFSLLNDDRSIEMSVFRNIDDATAWLGQNPMPAE